VNGPFTDVTGDKLSSLTRHYAVNHARVTTALFAAPTRRRQRQFVRPVGDREEPSRGRKDVQEKVRRKAEGVHVDVAIIDEPGQRVDLRDARKRLVTIPSSLRSPKVQSATSLRPSRSCQQS
jgi:hypothetical protein